MGIKMVYQHDLRDCGAACLSMIASHYGIKQPISTYRELTKTDKSGTNFYGLVEGATKLGLDAEALSGAPEELLHGLKDGSIELPFIAHIVSDNTMHHYVVVYGVKDNFFLVADPGKGKSHIPFTGFFEMWTGHIVTFKKTSTFQEPLKTKKSFSSFSTIIKGQYSKLAIVLLISVIVSFIGIAGAFVFEIVIDNFALTTESYKTDSVVSTEHIQYDHSDESIFVQIAEQLSESTESFNIIFLALISLYVFQSILQYIRGHLIAKASRDIDTSISLSYYHHITNLPVSSILTRQTGEYLSRFSDIGSIRQAISEASVTLLMDSIMVIGCGIILYLQNALLFSISFLMIVMSLLVVLVYRKPLEKANRNVMEHNARLQALFKENIDGIETIKAKCAEDITDGKTSNKYLLYITSAFKNTLLYISQETISGGIELVGSIVILWLGFAMVLNGTISIGTLITFYALLSFFTQPIKNLAGLQPTIQTALVALDRLNDILDLETEDRLTGESVGKIKKWEAKCIEFRYGNHELTLKDICFTIMQGEKIAIVGESGSGKTTLARLMLRFYTPESGTIYADEQSIQEINLNDLRRKIAYVSQNTFFFADTIMENLKLGTPDATYDEVIAICKKCHADEFIREMPFGYETPINENGANLSGGQRQRLAIAQALLQKPQLLILDEATSNLDTITEALIRNTIFSLDNTLTVIMIAHRLQTVKHCDRILVMEKGTILEQGTHDELYRMNGKYTELWSMQQ